MTHKFRSSTEATVQDLNGATRTPQEGSRPFDRHMTHLFHLNGLSKTMAEAVNDEFYGSETP